MKYTLPTEESLKGPESEVKELRYSRLRICHLCTLTKMIPEEDRVCKDCWALRMMGFAQITCPYFQYEYLSPLYPEGRVPIEFCYDCAYRRGWTEELGPICSHPAAVSVIERMGVDTVPCPERRCDGEEGLEVLLFKCTACPWYRGELTTLEGRFAYCAWPSSRPMSPDVSEQDSRIHAPRARDQACGCGE